MNTYRGVQYLHGGGLIYDDSIWIMNVLTLTSDLPLERQKARVLASEYAPRSQPVSCYTLCRQYWVSYPDVYSETQP